MANKKEVNILLLGIVAILAIVGLVLLFTSPAATGKNVWQTPQLPPTVEVPSPVTYDYTYTDAGLTKFGQRLDLPIIPRLEGANLPRCPNGRIRTRGQGNIPYAAIPGHLCDWFYCPGVAGTSDPAATPILACTPV